MKNMILLLLITFNVHSFSQDHSNHLMQNDKPSTHGMLIFGKEKIYASHLPMFHSPHDYQIIIELTLDKATKQKFVNDQKLHPEYTAYTIEPEKFVLPDMINNPKPFKVNLYRGHFERGGIKIATDITVSISQVVYFQKFNPTAEKITTTNFILFGNSKEQFLTHQISNKPDFEQIMEIRTQINGAKFELISLNKSSNQPIGIGGNELLADEKKILLLKQLYLEFDDLKE